MKRVLAVLLCLLCAMLLLVACGDNNTDTDNQGNNNTDNQGHTHTYKTNEDWSKDAQGHWYDATCDCEDAPITKLNHTDANNDGACDVCTFTNHEHEYTEDWTADCTNHWNAADCGHTVPGTNVGAHVDENADGRCDVCNYIIEDLHEHYYSSEWSNDGEYHWHAALCEHKVEVADKAAHVINDAGTCTVCDATVKEIDKTDILAVIKAAIANNFKVVSGNVHYDEIVYDTPTSILANKTDEVFFVLGNGDSYILLKNYNGNGDFIGGEQQYYETLENGEYFGIMMPIGGIDLNITQATAEKLNGYNYTPGSILAAGYDDCSTLAQTIANFYDLMTTQETVKDAVTNYDAETGKYSFSFEYLAVDATLQHPSDGSGGEGEWVYQAYVYFVDVEFTVTDDYVIDYCTFSVESYRNWELDEDITYDPETNTYEMLDTASASIYSYEVSQISGERTFTTIYPKAAFVPQNFELFFVTGTDYDDDAHLYVTDEVEIVDTDGDGIVDLILDPYTFVRLHIGNVIPSSAIPSFMDAPVVTYENLNGSGTPWGSEANFQAPSFSAYMNCISFFTIDSGEYMFTIDTGAVQKKIHVTISGEAAPDLNLDTPTDFHVKVTEESAYIDEYNFVADKAGVYTFNLPAGLGFSSERGAFVTPGVAYGSNEEGATVTFECWEGREITYYVAAGTRGWYNITVDFEAADIQEPVDPSEAMTGVYDAVSGTYTGVLTIDGAAGTLTFVHEKGTLNYTFTVENGKVIIYNDYGPISSTMAQYLGILTIDENNVPVTFTYSQREYTLTLQGSAPAPDPEPDPGEDKLNGSGTENDPYILTESGEYIADYKGGSNLVYYSFTATQNGIVTFTSKFDGTPWMKLGVVENGGYLEELSTFVPAGATVIFQMGDWDEQAGDVPFEMSFVAKDSDDFSALVGTWYGQSNDFWTVDYTLVINADGTGTLTYVAFENVTDGTIEYIFVDGKNVTISYKTAGLTGTLACTYDGTAFVCTQGAMSDMFTFQTTPIENGGGEGGEGDDVTDPVKAALEGTYKINDTYSMKIYTLPDIGYVAEVYSENWSIDLYFTFDVTDNYDGSYTLALTSCPRPDYEAGTDKIDEILALDITITPSEAGGDDIGGNEGSAENPFTITEPGDYYAFFPGGYEPIWFTYEITQNGYVTITTEYANPWFQYGTTIDYVQNNMGPDGGLKTITFYAFAGETVYISVGDYDFVEAGVEFSVSFEAFETESSSNLVGTWNGTETDDFGSSSEYTFVVNADGKGTGSANYGYYTEEFDITFILVNDTAVTIYAVTTGEYGGTEYTFSFTYDATLNALVGETFNLILSTGNDEGGDAPAGTENDPFVIESLPATLTQGAGHDVWYTFTITEDGTYVLAYPQGCYVEKLPSGAEKDMSARTWTFDATAGTVIKFNVYTSGVNESYEYSLTKFEKPAEPDGTKENPYIVDTLPYTLVVEGKYNVYLQYTATEDVTIVIEYPANGIVSGLTDFNAVKDSEARTYTFDLKAGDVVLMNPWTLTQPSEAQTYIIRKADQVVVPDEGGEEGGEGEGGGASGSAETYVNGNVTIVIDKSADLLQITRNTTTYVYSYSATYALANNGVVAGTVYDANGGYTNVMNLTFNDDGTVKSFVWYGQTYTDFVKQ